MPRRRPTPPVFVQLVPTTLSLDSRAVYTLTGRSLEFHQGFCGVQNGLTSRELLDRLVELTAEGRDTAGALDFLDGIRAADLDAGAGNPYC